MTNARLYPARKDYRVGAYEHGKLKETIPCTDENEVRSITRMLESQGFTVRLRVGAQLPANLESENE